MATVTIRIDSECNPLRVAQSTGQIRFHDDVADSLVFIISQDVKDGTAPLRFRCGVEGKAVQGVTVEFTDSSVDLTVNRLSGEWDYALLKCLATKFCEYSGQAVLDSIYTFSSVDEAKSFKWDEWIDYTMTDDFGHLEEFIKNYGAGRTYEGLFIPFTVGPRLMHRLRHNPRLLMSHLLWMQNYGRELYNATDTIGVLYNEDTREKVSLSIFNFEKPNFAGAGLDGAFSALLLQAHALCLTNDDHSLQRIVRFHHVKDIFNGCEELDEEQIIVKQPLRNEYLEETLGRLEIFAEANVFKDYMYPGRGLDEEQQTFILVWNREESPVSRDDFRYWMDNIRAEDSNWRVADGSGIRIGDRWLLLETRGDEPVGIAGSGIFDSNPWINEENDGRYYVDLIPNVLADSQEARVISGAELRYRIPSVDWKGIESGHRLNHDEALEIEKLWAATIQKWESNPENKGVRVLRDY